MQLTRRLLALLILAFTLAGGLGAAGVWSALVQYQRYQVYLATVDALVQVVQKNLQEGKLTPLPGAPAPGAK